MTMNGYSEVVQSLMRREVIDLPTYDPGADPEAVSLKFGLKRIIKLSNNENPFGISPAAALAIHRRLEQGMGGYPDPAGKDLCRVLAQHHDVDQKRIIIGNGSENILELLCQAFLATGDNVVTQAPCFGLHEIFPLMMGARVKKAPLTESFGFDEPVWRKALGSPTKIIFISNPSNPVGSVFSGSELETIIRFAPEDSLLVIDEAYFEYARAEPSYPDALQLLRTKNRPWIVLRTFSKAYGLAGLRVGYGVASHTNLIEALHRVRTPYNVNQLAQEAAIAALEDTDHLSKSVDLIATERMRITAALRHAGFRVAPSLANFLFIDTRSNAADMVQKLLGVGVIVKAWRESGYQMFIRASLSLPDENDAFLKAFVALKGS